MFYATELLWECSNYACLLSNKQWKQCTWELRNLSHGNRARSGTCHVVLSRLWAYRGQPTPWGLSRWGAHTVHASLPVNTQRHLSRGRDTKDFSTKLFPWAVGHSLPPTPSRMSCVSWRWMWVGGWTPAPITPVFSKDYQSVFNQCSAMRRTHTSLKV